MRITITRLAFVLTAAFAADGAFAQGMDGQSYEPAVGAAGGFVVERPVVPRHLGFGIGVLTNYANDLVVERTGDTGTIVGHPLEHAYTLNVVGSLALLDVLELGIDVPIDAIYIGEPTTLTGTRLAASPGLGDVRFVPKLAYTWPKTGFALGLAVPVTFPTGDPIALRGDGVFAVNPEALIGYRGNRWGVAANAGAALRTGGSIVESALTYSLGGQVALWPNADVLDLLVEAHGSTFLSTTHPSLENFPVELLAGVGITPHPDWTIETGAGVGITRGLTDPRFRVMLGVRYAPKPATTYKDSDNDGVSDASDRCARKQEDQDGFEDEDGCPEADNDGDGVLDDNDECPDEAEGPKGDGDGCPEGEVTYRDRQILIRGKVQFETGSSALKPKSERLLDRVAAVLNEHPELKKVRIEGHTDDVGPESTNQTLSSRRAESVKRALVARGVSSSRLQTVGYGESRPIAPNKTNAGRAKNRRVAFVIVD